jgi:hypothetical protein
VIYTLEVFSQDACYSFMVQQLLFEEDINLSMSVFLEVPFCCMWMNNDHVSTFNEARSWQETRSLEQHQS